MCYCSVWWTHRMSKELTVEKYFGIVMNTMNINELWSVSLLHSCFHVILKALKEKLSQLYPRKSLFLSATLGICCIRRFFAKAISESMLGKTFVLFLYGNGFILQMFSPCWVTTTSSLPQVAVLPFSVWWDSQSRSQAAAWAGEYQSVWKCFGQPSGRCLQRTAVPLAWDWGRAPLQIHAPYWWPSCWCRCSRCCDSGWGEVVAFRFKQETQ